MDAEGIELYTITFGSVPSASTQDLYRGCATSAAHYFHSPTNEALIAAFRKIGGELSQLRIVR